jgi:aminobenzoyl-glutamate utilization protein B
LEVLAKNAVRYIDEKLDQIVAIADTIWEYAELCLHENKSAAILVENLLAEGFKVETGAGGIPSAIVAEWGSGKPVIGILAEYDALTNCSNKAVPFREPVVHDGPGHGCGHNLIGAASYAAAIGLKKEMEVQGVKGTVRFYGCPAEEGGAGKAFMARDGAFKDCDIALAYHPATINRVKWGSTLASDDTNFTFYGRSAHAAADPHNGRSALDAMQLMNIGMEFLREHMLPQTRIHYTITMGGGQPNVVPPEAQVWVRVRAADRDMLEDLWKRVVKCAEGAALMTETTVKVDRFKCIYNVLPNSVVAEVADECLHRVGPPKFAPQDYDFAAEISKSIDPAQKRTTLRRDGIPREWWDKYLLETVLPHPVAEPEPRGSDDAGDVSHCCPYGGVTTASLVMGTPGHSWQFTAQAGMGIGHAGMIAGAKALAETGYVLMTRPDLVEKAWAEFRERTGGREYRCAMSPDQKPAFHMYATKP